MSIKTPFATFRKWNSLNDVHEQFLVNATSNYNKLL